MTHTNPPTAKTQPQLEGVTLAEFFDASPVATFVINSEHVVTHFNKACESLLGINAADMIGKSDLGQVFYGRQRPVLANLIVAQTLNQEFDTLYASQVQRSHGIVDAYESEGFFPNIGESGRWLFFTATPLRKADGTIVGAMETLQDITGRKLAEGQLMEYQSTLENLIQKRTEELAQANRKLQEDVASREVVEKILLSRNAELSQLNIKLSVAQEHLIQSEKLASIGQLAAGLAHEINNPIGYIFSNFGTLENYLADLFQMIGAYEKAEATHGNTQTVMELASLRQKVELDFLKDDIPTLMRESKEGIVRVRKIVQDLKDFSHVEANLDWQYSNLNQGIDSTLNVVNSELKYKADVVKNYGDIPEVQCVPSQVNQVVMNLVVNAAHAMGTARGTITVSTGVKGDSVWISIADTGSGIPKDVLPRIFDPFYTTKPIGKGTGLGLSISYGIIQHHHGSIDVQTEVGKGTTFYITLPITQAAPLSTANGASHT